MKKLLILLLISFGLIGTSYADAVCRDGWISKSSGSGTCSWHGGVKKWLNKKKFNDDGFYWSDDEIFDPCEKRNRFRGQTEQECLNSPWSNANRIKRIMEEQNNDSQLNQILRIMEKQNNDIQSNQILQIMQEQNIKNRLQILRIMQEKNNHSN